MRIKSKKLPSGHPMWALIQGPVALQITVRRGNHRPPFDVLSLNAKVYYSHAPEVWISGDFIGFGFGISILPTNRLPRYP